MLNYYNEVDDEVFGVDEVGNKANDEIDYEVDDEVND